MNSVAHPAETAEAVAADPIGGFAAPWFDLAMAFEVADNGERTWAESLREAADTVGGELLFVLPTKASGNNDGEHGVVRVDFDGNAALVFVSREGVDTAFGDEAKADETLAAFARASMTMFDQLRGEPAILSPLDGAPDRDQQH
ncbi:MAG: hypothetical protein ACTSSQ_00185 [Alphaproteobacteria bacterium]